LTRYSISGVERRGQLVAAARDLAALFDVDDRVTFIEGGVGTAEALAPDAYYFFNPFGEYVFRAVEFDDDGIPTDEDVQRDLDATVGLLARAPAGTFVVTYNGFGGDRKSTRLNSSHVKISYAVFCLKKKKNRREKYIES